MAVMSGVALPVSEPRTGDCVYGWDHAVPPHSCAYLTGRVVRLCRELAARRVLDIGCGNGALAAELAAAGFAVTGCDDDAGGVEVARKAVPAARFERLSVYDDPARLGESGFDVAVSTEVVEHLFQPGALPRFAAAVLRPHGHLVLTTPYHGYLKNLVLSLTNKWDQHFSPLWDGGHVKFWSPATITQLLDRAGFDVIKITGAGRVRWLWKSMIVVARKRG
jgi:2-polyprenyl-3-methyl-5-hydroxy-6-metoxy-1,4-benzoquinol methylase